jgi:hypothetical protein
LLTDPFSDNLIEDDLKTNRNSATFKIVVVVFANLLDLRILFGFTLDVWFLHLIKIINTQTGFKSLILRMSFTIFLFHKSFCILCPSLYSYLWREESKSSNAYLFSRSYYWKICSSSSVLILYFSINLLSYSSVIVALHLELIRWSSSKAYFTVSET